MFQEPIEKVIERCRSRIDLSLDCNIADITRLIEEVENQKNKKNDPERPTWYGMGTGD